MASRYLDVNAIAVDARGKSVPVLPFVKLGEARFDKDFLGNIDGTPCAGSAGG